MKEILQFYANKLSASSLSLKKKSLLVDKPWAYIDENGVLMKLIFRSNRTVIIAQNGKVTEGEWEYIGATKNLLFGNGQDKFLLKEAFLDPNVLVMSRDGFETKFIALLNEDIIPDYDLISYLRDQYIKKQVITSYQTREGSIIDICRLPKYDIHKLAGKLVEIFTDGNLLSTPHLSEGRFDIPGKEVCIYVKEGVIKSVFKLMCKQDENGEEFLIEADSLYPHNIRVGDIIRYVNTSSMKDKVVSSSGVIYKVSNGRIQQIGELVKKTLKEGFQIEVEKFSNLDEDLGYSIRTNDTEMEITNGVYHNSLKREKVYIVDGKVVTRRMYRKNKRADKNRPKQNL